jgi:hypothetical protein
MQLPPRGGPSSGLGPSGLGCPFRLYAVANCGDALARPQHLAEFRHRQLIIDIVDDQTAAPDELGKKLKTSLQCIPLGVGPQRITAEARPGVRGGDGEIESARRGAVARPPADRLTTTWGLLVSRRTYSAKSCGDVVPSASFVWSACARLAALRCCRFTMWPLSAL